MTGRLLYKFGPVERRGILGPIRAGQAAVVATAVLLAVALLDQSPTASGAALAILVLGIGIALATLSLGRRTLEEWAPVLMAFALRALRRQSRHRSAAPSAGIRVRGAGSRGPRIGASEWCPAPSLRDLQIAQADCRGRPLGVFRTDRGRRLTSVLACRVVAFALLDPEAQERRLARWGLILSGAAASPISRLQWVERTAPAQADELARWVHDERDPAIPLRGHPMIDSYLELIGGAAAATHEHEILLAIQIDARRVRRRGSDAPLRALVEQTERVAQGLEAAEVTVLGALGPSQLARSLRTAFDPYILPELAALEAGAPEADGAQPASAWPLGAREAWDHYQSDGALHATYWIGAWPRVEVSPMFMDALLGRSSSVRAVAVTFEPLAPERSTRDVEAAVTRDQADSELRRRFGQSQTARQRQAAEATLRREAELAAGHCEVRLAGFVTVTGHDADDLRRACAEVCDHAARARLELHRMYGQQADAFTFTLPLCRGLR